MLTRLVLLIAIAMTTAWLQGKRTQSQGLSDYICRSTENHRNRRRHSNFWRGLYGLNWIAACLLHIDWIEEIMIITSRESGILSKGIEGYKAYTATFVDLLSPPEGFCLVANSNSFPDAVL